jgi:processive 1,2-diacylglycerol beta-glucosyltransferase
MYANSVNSYGGTIFKLYYWITDKLPFIMRWYASAKFTRHASKRLEELKPDLVISTFAFLGHVTLRARKRLGVDCPIITTITDANDVQGIWLCGQEDKILTATPETISYAVKRGIARERLDYIGGLPLKKKYEIMPTMDQARTKLHIPNNARVVAIISGGMGLGSSSMLNLAKEIANTNLPLYYLFICGNNDELRTGIDNLGIKNSQLFGYVENIEQIYAASDAVCTKGGWLTLSELIAIKKPFAVVSSLPGQEEQNLHYVTSHGYGEVRLTTKSAIKYLRGIASVSSMNEYNKKLANAPTAKIINSKFRNYCLAFIN